MKYKLIDTAGQITAVILERYDSDKQSKIAKSLMQADPRIEQVGYLLGDSFTMMGGELSINGTIAAAFLSTNTTINDLKFWRPTRNSVSLQIPQSIIKSKVRNIVELEGITYQVDINQPESQEISDEIKIHLQKIANSYPAAGIIFLNENRIKPLIYVKGTDTYVWENACGSGSLAAALVSGRRTIIQPSGGRIRFRFNKKSITVTTTVKEI